jgi:3-oxoacyl-[acyl-carrier protein] reductase
MSFEGKSAVVTGGGGGLGAAYASALSQNGATVVVVDRTEALAAATAETIRKNKGNCHAFGADLAQWSDVENCFQAIVDRLGRIDILINNAGGGSSSPGNASSIEKIEPLAWEALLDANLTTAFLAIRAAAPVMKRQRYGKIVNVASRSARVADPKFAQSPAYACAKTAVLCLTRFAARELGPHGVTVNCVVPGLVLSGPMLSDYWQRLGQTAQDAYLTELALKRLPRIEEIVAPVLFLCSDDSGYITGVSLDVNGGSFMPA